MKVTKVSWNI